MKLPRTDREVLRRWNTREVPIPHWSQEETKTKSYPRSYRRDFVCTECGGKAREVLLIRESAWEVSNSCKGCLPYTYQNLKPWQKAVTLQGKHGNVVITIQVDEKTGKVTWQRDASPPVKQPVIYKTFWQALHATKEENDQLGELQTMKTIKLPRNLEVKHV